MRPRARLAAILCILALTLTSSFSLVDNDASAQTALCPNDPSQIGVSPDGWEAIAAPPFPAGTDGINAYAVDPREPNSLFVTNGTVIMRSTDGGCTFQEVFNLEASGDPMSSSSIVSLEIGSATDANGRVYAVVAGPGGVVSPRVFSSSDSGTSWVRSSSGLPAVGTPVELAVSESEPATLYLALNVSSARGVLMYKSSDAGSTWATPTDVSALLQSPEHHTSTLTDIAVDPIASDSVWAATSSGLAHSSDGGATWKEIADITAGLNTVDVMHAPGTQARVVAFASTGSTAYWSFDGGRDWVVQEGVPWASTVQSVAHDSLGFLIALASSSAEVYQERDLNWKLLMSPSIARQAFLDITTDHSLSPSIYAHTSSALWRQGRFISQPPPPPPPPPTDELPVEDPCRVKATGSRDSWSKGNLTPPHLNLTLAVGEEMTVPYKLKLPPLPRRGDVYFLVDTTGSMRSAIEGLRDGLRQIASALAGSGMNIFMGAGEFKDLGDPYPYRRLSRIGPGLDHVECGLNMMTAKGGGSALPEAALTALYQSASGKGQAGLVRPNKDAGFREEALRAIVNVTDAAFQEGSRYPTWDDTIGALRSEDILQVGIAVNCDFVEGVVFPQDASRCPSGPDLQRMAMATGALAPSSGVDCDGDGDVDLQPGDALVCAHYEESVAPASLNLAPAIVELLKAAFAQDAPVKLTSTEGGKVVSSIQPDLYPAVDLGIENLLSFEVTFTCSAGQVGTTSEVTLQAQVRTAAVATATAAVTCSAPAIRRPDRGAALPLAPAPPPPPPPGPHNQLNPNTQPRVEQQAQQQAQQQTQANAQAAAVAQRQEQPQMAFVHAAQQLKEQSNAQYAMSRMTTGRSDPVREARYHLALTSIALMLAIGHSLAVARTLRTRSARWR